MVASVSVGKNPVRQVLIPQQTAVFAPIDCKPTLSLADDLDVTVLARRRTTGDDPAFIIGPEAQASTDDPLDFSAGKWVGPRNISNPEQVLAALDGCFDFKLDGGLRSPQIGAVHSVIGYWTSKPREPATVVMPTGTGKTDTMIAIFAAQRPERLLVVVPSDALRVQIAERFERFGVLQERGVVATTFPRPVVGQFRHGFHQPDEAVQFAQRCNVVVATPQILAATRPEARAALFGEFSHLFVDEAHHVAARTWREIRDGFAGKPVVQFTATPFREDGQHLGGRLIYEFPLREAQAQNYYSTINYAAVLDLGDHDQAIAERAVKQLEEDLANGFDHLLMARVARRGRADDLLPQYRALAPQFEPIVLYSTMAPREREHALNQIGSRKSRIIICVNMLGEGFDLPQLKIAAIHDPHKSIGITLQFVGRFARNGDGLGDATVVVGRPERDFDPQLRRLYSENSDWNLIIRELSEGAVEEQVEITEFENAFGSLPDEVSMRSLLPKMSTVVYRAPNCDGWDPQAVLAVFPEEKLYTFPIAVNERDGVAWFVTEIRQNVKWGDLRTVEEVAFNLYVIYWDNEHRLLYINSSNNGSMHEGLAKAIVGDSAKRYVGEDIYRVMADVKRLVPTNVGLLDVRNRARRFSMLVGADVSEGFPVAEASTKTKTNIFAFGYEEGGRVSIGASLKGRIWSYRIAETLKHWVDWCDHIGAKLRDDTVSVDDVMRNFIRPEVLEERPQLVAIAVEWPWTAYLYMSEELKIRYAGMSHPLIDVDLTVTSFTTDGPIKFKAVSPDWEIRCELYFTNGQMRYRTIDPDAKVVTRTKGMTLEEYLNIAGIQVLLEQDAVIVHPGMLLKPDRDLSPFDPDKLRPLDWTGIKLEVESQGPSRRQDSVQARTIQHVLGQDNWDVVLDDDGSGEVADIVAIRIEPDRVVVGLTHCKYVHGGKPRSQVGDLYEVCGQAQKSVEWRRNVGRMFEFLRRRERLRLDRGAPSGFIKGDVSVLYGIEDAARLMRSEFEITVAQPGLTKAGASPAQMELLASTELYLYETAFSQLSVLCSP